jgi:hypothetical protein
MWADEAILLSRGTKVWDVCEEPSFHTNLDDGSQKSGDGLDQEGRTGWDLHVMAQLKILHEGESGSNCLNRHGLENLGRFGK